MNAADLGALRRAITRLSRECDRLWSRAPRTVANERRRQEAARQLEALQLEHQAATGWRWYGAREWAADAWRRRRSAAAHD